MKDREADLKYLDNRIKKAKTLERRNLAAHKAQMIHEQLADKKLVDLRGKLVDAERKNDAKRAEEIRKAIMGHTQGRWS